MIAKLGSIVIASTICSLFSIQVLAQTEEVEFIPVSEVFEDAYFSNSGNAYQNESIVNRFSDILGINGFPEQQILRDGKLVDSLYRDGLLQQTRTGSPMVTRDLANPYNTSVGEELNNLSF